MWRSRDLVNVRWGQLVEQPVGIEFVDVDDYWVGVEVLYADEQCCWIMGIGLDEEYHYPSCVCLNTVVDFIVKDF